MATGVNNNAAVVVVGRTAPVPPGQQTAANSVPVVIASDQSAIPVEEQNKQQSEVALSLLGIPRSEVALGIFADVNTYDVNPTEWSFFPEQFGSLDIRNDENELVEKHVNLGGDYDWGLTHIPEEAGAMIEAPADEYSILTSKRFFRYQPGRVSAATFGVKLSRAPYTVRDNATTGPSIRNPSIKKYGIFDKFDGYYFESKNDGYGDNFVVVRRTQSIIRDNPLPFGSVVGQQDQDYAWVGVPQVQTTATTYPRAYEIVKANKRYLQELAVPKVGDPENNVEEYDKCRRDAGLIIEGILHDLSYGGNASTVYNTLRFFNPVTKGLYVDNVGTEINRYRQVRNALAAILNGSAPSSVGINNSFSGGTAAGTIAYVPASALGITPEGPADSKTDELFNILLVALGDGSSGPQFSSIPDPTGSAAGEMCILRDGLVMIHAAADDPSLLKERTNFKIVELFNDPSNPGYRWLKVLIEEGSELLQIGQGVFLQKNEKKGYFQSDVGLQTADGSIWYVFDTLKTVNDGPLLYQYVRLSLQPANEEIFTGVGGTNNSNPWGGNNSLAYPDPGVLNIISAFDTSSGTPVQFNETSGVTNVSSLGFTLQTPVPFILPNDSRRYVGQQYTDESRPGQEGVPAGSVDGSFPYLYPPGGANDPQSVGYVDSVFSDTEDLKTQMNYVNKRLFKNWVWFNVDPKYYKVYEYRVPRSRMSGEKLNGSNTPIIYSDNVLDNKAGSPVLEPSTGEQKVFESVWELDPTKVTMYKVEFSWYGAVGATFLAYVPIENNEARWVRVHHLRASNQLKVASLGNATLPITYLTYGGGNQNAYGYLNEDRVLKTESGYGSISEQLTKYGASYYIDGGDRGTVRLFSYASDNLKEIGGSKYLFDQTGNPSLFANSLSYAQTTIGPSYVNAPFLQLSSPGGLNGQPEVSDYYMNARVVTDSPTDQDVRVVWTDSSQNRIYLSRILNATSGQIRLIVDRPQPLVGIRCRTEINGVRNRVQIYPTRLATGVTSQSESMVVQLIKSPVFQTFTDTSGTLSINSGGIDIGRRGKRTLLPVGEGANTITVSNDYIPIGESVWGYFRYTIKGDTSGLAFTTLGLLDRAENGRYFFSAYEVSVDDHIIRGTFLPAGRWSGPGPQSPDFSNITTPFPTSVLARLSAVETDSEQRSPIPGTGTVVTTLFSPNSGEEYELSPYFDYNKDYLSFPLTDVQETLYICASSRSFYLGSGGSGTYVNRGEILSSITWEEQ